MTTEQSRLARKRWAIALCLLLIPTAAIAAVKKYKVTIFGNTYEVQVEEVTTDTPPDVPPDEPPTPPEPPPPSLLVHVPGDGTLRTAFDTITDGGRIEITESIDLEEPVILGNKNGQGAKNVTIVFLNGAVIRDAIPDGTSGPESLISIGTPGCKITDFAAVGKFGPRRCLKVHEFATGFAVNGFKASCFARHCLDIDASDSRIENYEIHRILWFDPAAPGGRADAHGIVTLHSKGLYIGSGKIWQCSGDCFQADRGNWDNIVITDADWFDAPLEEDAGGFNAGDVLSENAIDTKTGGTGQKRLTIRNSKFHGIRTKKIAIAAALNIKEAVDADIQECAVYDSFVGLRAVGSRNGKRTRITFVNNTIDGCDVAVRGEDKLANFVFKNNRISNCGKYYEKGSASSEPWTFQGWAVEENTITDPGIIGQTWKVMSGDTAAISSEPLAFPIPPITDVEGVVGRNDKNRIVAE